ncbi:TonB-dependent receptor [Microbulbifer taiwanensis]|uniref:Tetratricopeptide repeat protein n=2 Tax=Microbulbifer taiwanensis TaxID=986746 RepID=A0ABW1YP60_9GAMM|nr:tetratricopeptide repeat protein [Microbulbifer taiwanensis]
MAPPVLLAQGQLAGGADAFKEGDYRRALTLFESEQLAGNDSAKLKYNIGVTLIKLGRYGEASRYFQRLLSEPRWRDLARYNLALAAERSNRKLIAAKHYRLVSEAADSQKLRSLAGSRLNTLAAAHRGPAARRGMGTVSLSAGRDDNAYALQNELLADASVGEDSFTEMFAWGQYRLSGSSGNGWRLHGYGFARRYSELDSLDLTSVSAALSRDGQWLQRLGWDAEIGAAGEMVYLGGEQVTRQLQLIGRARRDIGEARVTLSLIPSYYQGGDEYAYLDGWRQRFEAKWQRPLFAFEARAYYRYDANARTDLERADLELDTVDYYSYSPVRHSLGGVLEWSLSSSWDISTGVEYRRSAYDGNNRVTDSDGAVLSYQRESDRTKTWLATKFKITPRFSLDGKFVVLDNEENRDVYTYDKTEASLGVSYIF